MIVEPATDLKRIDIELSTILNGIKSSGEDK
jgi:hypothetical protein